jgi:(2Fe-2S) ferredoxin
MTHAMESEVQKQMSQIVEKLALPAIKKHLILCAGPKCCQAEAGEQTWQWLKERSRQPDFKEHGIFRTKATCLRVCFKGPIALVYPDGTWYQGVTPEVCEMIVNEHLLQGRPVKAYQFAVSPDMFSQP